MTSPLSLAAVRARAVTLFRYGEHLFDTRKPPADVEHHEGRWLPAADFNALLDEVQRLRDALEFYADKSNYTFWTDDGGSMQPPKVTLDYGDAARAALAKGR